VELDRSLLERYIALDKSILALEAKSVIKTLEMKRDDLKEYESQVTILDAKYKEAVQKTAKEKADVDEMDEPSVKQFFCDQGEFDAKLSKEKATEEYLEALNEQEIAQKELEAMQHQRDHTQAEISTLQQEVDQLNALYKEQDQLLASIFDGEYGSELEDRLECQLDDLQDRKQRIGVAKYKWANSRVLLQYACNQLAFVTRRWQEVIQVGNVQQRYAMATEVRNNLVAANQNIMSAKRYLDSVQFPYCNPNEMATLTKATMNIYTDMQTPDRHGHAQQCYTVTYGRASALLQWFDMVINTTITQDLEGVVKLTKEKQKQLRAERLSCIKEKIRESKGGSQVDLSIADEMDLGDEPEEELAFNSSDVAFVVEGDQAAPLQVAEQDDRVPSEELAPAPDQLFGNIDELKKKHEQEMTEFNKTQDTNKARMEQGLEEKLKARRNRRKRDGDN